MKLSDNEFTNGEITVTYEPKKCIHSENCARGLSDVFRTSVIPWIHLDGADSSIVVEQVKKCPSGALSYCYNKELATVK
ncbi:MAG: (4Fe-4S)-binding protein [Bacteroidia bacterium]|nr:(4Fe-4S)-binding protein [Bacteroidia bacterium]NNF31332.1 (4Fe-4S)-binding protein [Flavobacteriaceae bacterium]MBT8276592.1 (4Fe-4S)-binding protein [Bacteroidia bacterium]NNJ82543.1 (4Fe-4S)-binding protein [Flavobacteriaceae bacterium]NNK54394.1 (4Fe-4S)-binding protein [Flavobacteriaceae bacterium]